MDGILKKKCKWKFLQNITNSLNIKKNVTKLLTYLSHDCCQNKQIYNKLILYFKVRVKMFWCFFSMYFNKIWMHCDEHLTWIYVKS